MNELQNRISAILDSKSFGSIATSNQSNVHNAMVAYYSENLNLYFGTYSDTLKGKYLKNNSQVAICIDKLQIHGITQLLTNGSEMYQAYFQKYLRKFPTYSFFYEIEHEFYQIEPLVIWLYNKNMHREKIIFDEEYYQRIKPYETNPYFKNS